MPADWRGLQRDVGRILHECGLDVHVEKQLATARGAVELDVLATEKVDGREIITVCECKYWQSSVPQNVVHGFRTVMADIGAHVGYIISTSGFQSGAYKAAENTNVQLVTWKSFQESFSETWAKRYMSPYIADRLSALLTYTEPLLPRWFGELSPEKQSEYLALKEMHHEFGGLVMAFTPFPRMFGDTPLPSLPLRQYCGQHATALRNVPDDVLDAVGLRDFLEAIVSFGDEIISQFRCLRPRAT
jgi:hypothetical protein